MSQTASNFISLLSFIEKMFRKLKTKLHASRKSTYFWKFDCVSVYILGAWVKFCENLFGNKACNVKTQICMLFLIDLIYNFDTWKLSFYLLWFPFLETWIPWRKQYPYFKNCYFSSTYLMRSKRGSYPFEGNCKLLLIMRKFKQMVWILL